MTGREHRRAQILVRVVEGAITLKEAAEVLGLSLRQARRLKGGLQREGPAALVHGNRGRRSPRRTPAAVREAVVAHYQQTYFDCNVQHFSELLAEREGIVLGTETVRRILRAAGVPTPKRRRSPYRRRRERMPAEGMLLQIDGSPFRWLGDSGPRFTLLGAIDDATSALVAAVFREQEDAAGYLELLRQVVTARGIPAAVYRDRHQIFELSQRARTVLEEDLAGKPFPTQVGRALAELGIESIAAHSPQAKGRVERSWRIQQDRLTSELRLAGITTIAGANAFLPDYLARYTAKFAVAPRSDEDAYVPLDPSANLDRLFCFKYQRRVAADNTIQFGGQVLQLPPGPERLSYARVIVEVHERLDHSVAVFYQGRQLLHMEAFTDPAQPLRARKTGGGGQSPPARPQPLVVTPAAPIAGAASAPQRAPSKSSKPAPTHPWRQSMLFGHFH